MASDGDICNFVDDNTIYQCCSNLSDIKSNIGRLCKLATSWFENNGLITGSEELTLRYVCRTSQSLLKWNRKQESYMLPRSILFFLASLGSQERACFVGVVTLFPSGILNHSLTVLRRLDLKL